MKRHTFYRNIHNSLERGVAIHDQIRLIYIYLL